MLRDPVGDEQIVVAVAIPVARRQTHRAPVFGHPRLGTGIDEAAMLVEIQLVFRNVVGHVEIQPAVAIEIVPQRAQAASLTVGDAELIPNFGECAVAVVVEQQVSLGLVGGRVKREGNLKAELLRRVTGITGFVPHIPANVKVEIAIAIVISPGRAGPESLQLRKPLVAHQDAMLVMEQEQRVVTGDDEIEPAVVVVVAPGGGHADDP